MSERFDLNLIRILMALDNTRSVTLAAHSLDMSQSGFSTALARLRRGCGDALFVRSPHGMEPTTRARDLIEAGRALVGKFETELQGGREFDPRIDATEFKIAMSDISEMTLLPTLYSALRRMAPHCTVRTGSLPPDQMAAGLESGQIDVAMGYIPDLKGSGIFQQQLLIHSFTCLLRQDHPLRARRLTKAQFESLEHV
ncbi:MAG: LysR family transcriptional regulator, partial [Rubrivivax sp.]